MEVKLENIEILKYVYIIVIALFYINLLFITFFEKVHHINRAISVAIVNTTLLFEREPIFDCIKKYYENERYRKIGISSIDILFPLIASSLGVMYCIIKIVLDNKKYRKNDMRKFNIYIEDYDDLKMKLNALKKKGVNSTYEIIESKNKNNNKNKNTETTSNTTVTFFNLPYEEALRYSQELDIRPYKSETEFIKYFSIIVVIAILDFSLVYFRFANDNYTTILEFIKMH